MVAPGLAGAAVLSVPAAFAQAKPIDTVTKSGDWVINYDENSCDLLTQFGPPKDLMFLKFTRYSPGDSTDLMITGSRLATGKAWLDATVDFGLGEKPTKRRAAGIVQAKRPGIMMTGVRIDGWDGDGDASEITPAKEAAVTGVVVRAEGKKPFRMQFGPLDRPMRVMRQCLTDLIQSWGYDPAVIQGLSMAVRPANGPGSWVTSDDYPTKALMSGHSGLLRFRLDVDETGKVAGCHILDRTDPDDFSALTCSILTKRSRFKPALDANGKPVKAFFMGSFTWKMPG